MAYAKTFGIIEQMINYSMSYIGYLGDLTFGVVGKFFDAAGILQCSLEYAALRNCSLDR